VAEALLASRLAVHSPISVADPQAWSGIEQLVQRATVPGSRWITRAEGKVDDLNYLLAVAGCPEVTPTPCTPGSRGPGQEASTATFAMRHSGEVLTILEDCVVDASRLVLLVGDEHLRAGLGVLRDGDTAAALGLARLALLRPSVGLDLVVAEAAPGACGIGGEDRSLPPAGLPLRASSRITSILARPRVAALGAAVVAIAVSGLAVAVIHSRSAAAPAAAPAPASGETLPALGTAAATFDRRSGQILLVGCCDPGPGGVQRMATWTSDGPRWRHLHPAIAPSWRASPGFASDPVSGDLLLQGGAAHHDTWTWNGATWTELHPAATPPDGPLEMVADPATRSVVALDPGTGRAAHGTWSWNGMTWTHLESAPPTRGPFGYDPGTRRVMAVVDAPAGAPDEQTWAFDGTSWGEVATPNVVPVEYFATPGGISDQMAADFVDRSVVYLEQPGVSPGYVIPGDTYIWMDGAWSHSPSPTPLERQGLLVAGDPAGHPLLIAPSAGGGNPAIFAWTGAGWSPVRPQG
jgi:hypothetical protein